MKTNAPRRPAAILTAFLTLDRSTKNTHVYTDNTNFAPVPTIYIQKSAFTADPPLHLELTLTPTKVL